MPRVTAEPYEFEFDPQSTALLVIDMQRDFVDPGGFGEALGNDVSLLRRAVASHAARARRRARTPGCSSSTPVKGIAPTCRDCPPAEEGPRTPGPRHRRPWPDGPHPGARRVRPRHRGRAHSRVPGEPVVDKPGKGSFYATDLDADPARARHQEPDRHRRDGRGVRAHDRPRGERPRATSAWCSSDCIASYFPEFYDVTHRDDEGAGRHLRLGGTIVARCCSSMAAACHRRCPPWRTRPRGAAVALTDLRRTRPAQFPLWVRGRLERLLRPVHERPPERAGADRAGPRRRPAAGRHRLRPHPAGARHRLAAWATCGTPTSPIQLAKREGRTDVTAMPYGPSVPHMFIVVFGVMLPIYLQTERRGARLAGRPGLVLHHRRDHHHRRVCRPDDPQVHAARRDARHAGRHLDRLHLDAAGLSELGRAVDRVRLARHWSWSAGRRACACRATSPAAWRRSSSARRSAGQPA